MMLTIIAIRNVIEMSGSEIAFLPKSFMRGKSLIESIFSVSSFLDLISETDCSLFSSSYYPKWLWTGSNTPS